jgi:hypothetical protein
VVSDKLEKLRAKREEMSARIRQELGRDRARKRREDTRRKIIAGALALTEEDPAIKAWLRRTLNKVLVRDDERALFGLPLLPGEPTAPLQPDAPSTSGELLPGAKAAREDEIA